MLRNFDCAYSIDVNDAQQLLSTRVTNKHRRMTIGNQKKRRFLKISQLTAICEWQTIVARINKIEKQTKQKEDEAKK